MFQEIWNRIPLETQEPGSWISDIFDTDPDAYPDPRILLFASDLQVPTKNNSLSPKFLCLFLFGGTSLFNDKKKHKEVKNSTNQGFSSFFVVDGRSWIRICTYKLQIRIQIQLGDPKTSYGPGTGSGTRSMYVVETFLNKIYFVA